MSKVTRLVIVLTGLFISSIVQAGTIYNVSSTPTINCGASPHGLWTNSYLSGGCNQYYDFQPGSTLNVNDMAGGTAVLNATAKNSIGDIATINITFSGFNETYANFKNGGTPDYNGTDNPVDWDFFNQILVGDGLISFDNGDVFDIFLVGQDSILGTPSVGMPVLQIGDGANDKGPGFGASAWLDAYQNTGGTAVYTGNAHWDLNMSLSPVPEPSMIALLTMSLAGLGLLRRRSRAGQLTA